MATSENVYKLDEIDYSNLILGKSGKVTKLLYNKNNLKLFTPKMQVMFLKNVEKEWLNYNEYSVECFLVDQHEKTKFTLFDNELERTIKRENKTDYGELIYFPLMKPNENYPQLIKIILPRDQYGNFETVVFDKDKNKILLTEDNIEQVLLRGVVFKGVIECIKVWNFNGKFGSIWKLCQLKLSELPKKEQYENKEELYDKCLIV